MLDSKYKELWPRVLSIISVKFGQGEEPDLDAVLFLIGVRELGRPKQRFKKDEKLDLLHIAICRVLLPYGYYERDGQDEEGWPHYRLVEKLPSLKAGEQSILMKTAVCRYFEEEGLLD